MEPDGRRIGAHLPMGHGMLRVVERAHDIGLDTLQVFSDNPTAWRRRNEPPRELPAFRARLAELGMGPIAIHASYLVNLAGPDPTFGERSASVLRSELEVAPSFGARFVNVHIGSHRGTDVATGIGRLADGVARTLGEVDDAPDGATLVLENASGGGDALGSSIEELAAILDAIAARGVPSRRVAVCLDTAHLWGAGYPISDRAGVDRLIDEVDRLIGLDRLAMIHLNDSKAALGSRADRHQHVGAGLIGAAGLGAILRDPRLIRVPYYLETPGMDEGYDAVNTARVRDLLAGRTLADLPPEAMDLRGSRARAHRAHEPDESRGWTAARRPAGRRPTVDGPDDRRPAARSRGGSRTRP
jgi:deoxyribonuclease-4